jgi:4-amino-4-deoxy-L-arabinose transferase-like glycosyltransferase
LSYARSPSAGPGLHISPLWERALLAVVLVAALTLRLYDLGGVPPGLTHDEASNGHDAAAVLRGVCPIYFTVGYGHEPLYPYSAAAVMAVLGPTDVALRLTTVCWGMATLLLTYAFARRLFGPLEGLLAAACMAVSFWCVMTSRIGLRAVTLAAVFTASAICFWKALPAGSHPVAGRPRRPWISLLCCGVLLGATIYTYMASRVVWSVYLLFLLYLLMLRLAKAPASGFRREWVAVGVVLVSAALVAAPLVRYLIAHPEAEQRIGLLAEPLRQALQGDLGPLWSNVRRSLPMFTFEGDPLWLYNIPGRPLLGAGIGALFYGGLLVCLWRWRDPRYAFVLLWLVVGVAPALASGPDATTLRSIAAQPAVFVAAAVAGATVVRFFRHTSGRPGGALAVAALGLRVAAAGARTAIDYFTTWGEHRDVRVAYHHTLVEQARYLDAAPESDPVAFSSIYPGRFHDPYTVEIALRRDDLVQSWFDGRHALVFPAAGEVRVIVPSIAPINEELQPLFAEYAVLIRSQEFRPDDLVCRFDVYRFAASDALSALLGALTDEALPCVSDADEADAECVELDYPVDFGGVLELLSYSLRVPSANPGGEVEVLTVWRVQRQVDPEVVVFVHLLGPNGMPIAQCDRLDAPSWSWMEGDAFAQLSRFAVPADTPAGLYALEAGTYAREDLSRLPIVVAGALAGDSVLLRPVEVRVE